MQSPQGDAGRGQDQGRWTPLAGRLLERPIHQAPLPGLWRCPDLASSLWLGAVPARNPCAWCVVAAGNGSTPPGEPPALPFRPRTSPGAILAQMGAFTGQGLVGRLLHTAELLLHRGHGVGSGVPAGQLPARFLTLSPGLASPGIGVGGWNWASAAAHLGHSVQAEDLRTRRVHRSAQLPAWSRRTPAGGDRGTAWAAASEPPNQITSQAVPTELMGQGGTGHSGASGGWKYPKSP